MPEEALPVEGTPLSQVERVVDTYVAPSKTFTDIFRSRSWWLPFLLIVIAGYLFTATVQTKVGWQQLVENEIHANPKLSDQMSGLPADQLATRERIMQYSFRGGFLRGAAYQPRLCGVCCADPLAHHQLRLWWLRDLWPGLLYGNVCRLAWHHLGFACGGDAVGGAKSGDLHDRDLAG